MPISIILSIAITFRGIFEQTKYEGKIWNKISHLLYIVLMCIIIYPLISDFVLAIGLKVNRISSNESINENFTVTYKNSSDTQNFAYGIIPNRKYDGPIDKLYLNKKEFELIYDKQEIKIEMQNGLFGIPFNPIIKE
ncbi:hypothetical protein LY08_01716 [Olleya aquimaris]|uniref:Uncharacterized protein n=2 Tax=Olleya aquimaris TaxID=639310 RepID=A0A327RC92_9FLAO|nr:hypothetical protein LY08_01716 [Olleya aquimaris]